jgi:hypothetical protein
MNCIKKTVLVLLFILSGFALHAQMQIYFIHKDQFYIVSSRNEESRRLQAPFLPLHEVGQAQIHRLILNSLEKSRINSLMFVGDSIEFNGVTLTMLYDSRLNVHQYLVYDRDTGIELLFGIGEFDALFIYSAVNFGKEQFDMSDKMASSFAVKLLLKKMTGIIRRKSAEPFEDGYDFKERSRLYNRFLSELSRFDQEEILERLQKFVQTNFFINPLRDITSDWTRPEDLYYSKEGDYKSVAFFYYYTLKQLNDMPDRDFTFDIRSYLVIELKKKPVDEINAMYYLDLDSKEALEREYRMVDAKQQINRFIDRNKRVIAPLFNYTPPLPENAVFLVTVKSDHRWIYTTGSEWIDPGIFDPDRTCSHYTNDGCYYSYVVLDNAVLANLPMDLSGIVWNVIYGEEF